MDAAVSCSALAANSITASSSGNAFSVICARGKFNSPAGQRASVQNVRTCAITSWSVSAPRLAPCGGIRGEKPRTGPPSCATANQSASGSRLANAQSLKSGIATLRFSRPGAPFPSAP